MSLPIVYASGAGFLVGLVCGLISKFLRRRGGE